MDSEDLIKKKSLEDYQMNAYILAKLFADQSESSESEEETEVSLPQKRQMHDLESYDKWDQDYEELMA